MQAVPGFDSVLPSFDELLLACAHPLPGTDTSDHSTAQHSTAMLIDAGGVISTAPASPTPKRRSIISTRRFVRRPLYLLRCVRVFLCVLPRVGWHGWM